VKPKLRRIECQIDLGDDGIATLRYHQGELVAVLPDMAVGAERLRQIYTCVDEATDVMMETLARFERTWK
jgi:hypothetical protein